MNEKILVIDDESSVREVARQYLEREGFIVYLAASGNEGLELAEQKQPSLLVLDLMLPDLSGEDIAKTLRKRSDVPILMLTAKGAEEDRIAGLELGADDYLVKPFSPRELVARVNAILRRAGGTGTPLVSKLSFDDGALEIDTVGHEVVANGEPVDLTPSEYKLLLTLAEYPGRVYSRFELINRVQGYDFDGYERTVDAHVKNLRQKIESVPRKPHYIQTVRGFGYRFARQP